MKTKNWQRGFLIFGVLGVAMMAMARGILAVLAVPKMIFGVFSMLMMDGKRVILSVFVTPEIIVRHNAALETTAKQDIKGLIQALKFYHLDNQRYPVTEQGLQALLIQPTIAPFPTNWKSGGYVGRLPRDPWGNPYQYLNPGVRGEIDIFSLGADDVPGGEGNDTDIRLIACQG